MAFPAGTRRGSYEIVAPLYFLHGSASGDIWVVHCGEPEHEGAKASKD